VDEGGVVVVVDALEMAAAVETREVGAMPEEAEVEAAEVEVEAVAVAVMVGEGKEVVVVLLVVATQQ